MPKLREKVTPVSPALDTTTVHEGYCDETRQAREQLEPERPQEPARTEPTKTARQVPPLFEEVPVTPVTSHRHRNRRRNPSHQQPIQLAMVKTTPPIRRVVHHQASTAASGCWQASIGNPLKRECLQYIKRPGGYVQLRNDAIDQGRQKYKQSVQNQSTALNTTLQQRSRTQVPLIFTGARLTLCHNKKRVYRLKK